MATTPLRGALRTLVPPRGHPDGRFPPLLLTLTVFTGVVDAVSYLSLGQVFVANMTGNVVFLGFALAGAGLVSGTASAVALAAFACGTVLGGRLAAAFGQQRERLFATATAIQVVLVAAATAAAGSNRSQYLIIVVLAIGTGLQSAAVRKLAIADISTNVLTMATTGLFADARWLGGPGSRLARRGASLLLMFAGALVGAVLLLHVSRTAALSLALVLIVAVAVAARVPWR